MSQLCTEPLLFVCLFVFIQVEEVTASSASGENTPDSADKLCLPVDTNI